MMSCGSAPSNASSAFSRTAALWSVCTVWQSVERTSASLLRARNSSTAFMRESASNRWLLRRMYIKTLFTSSLFTVPCTVNGCCAFKRTSTCGGSFSAEGDTLIPATCAVCISIELKRVAEPFGVPSSMLAFCVFTPVCAVFAARCCNSLGPSIPTEKPINKSRAALHAGAGEIQLVGSNAPTARLTQPCSSSLSNASSKLARHPANSAASGSVRLLDSNATSAFSCASVSLHRSHSTRWLFISAISDASSSPAANRVHFSSNPLQISAAILSCCSCCISFRPHLSKRIKLLELDQSLPKNSPRLPHPIQACPQLPRRAKQRILYRLFRRPQHLPNRSQFQSLIMLHLENHSLAWRKPVQRRRNMRTQLLSQQMFLRIRSRP